MVEIALLPKTNAKIKAQLFQMDLVKRDDKWLVNSWYPEVEHRRSRTAPTTTAPATNPRRGRQRRRAMIRPSARRSGFRRRLYWGAGGVAVAGGGCRSAAIVIGNTGKSNETPMIDKPAQVYHEPARR